MPILKPPIYIGVDPGKTGGIATVQLRAGGIHRVDTYPMPETERDIFNCFFGEIPAAGYDCFACIEHVTSSPQMGVASAFTFGKGYGGLRMALIALGIPFEEVRPQLWQKALGIPKRTKKEEQRQFKKRLRAFAQQLFPTADVTLETADALLIAEYCRRKQRGLL